MKRVWWLEELCSKLGKEVRHVRRYYTGKMFFIYVDIEGNLYKSDMFGDVPVLLDDAKRKLELKKWYESAAHYDCISRGWPRFPVGHPAEGRLDLLKYEDWYDEVKRLWEYFEDQTCRKCGREWDYDHECPTCRKCWREWTIGHECDSGDK